MASGTQAATARDGRTLRFAEWGDPAGFAVFSLHGTPGSRFSRHCDESTYAEVGARVIIYDRPGYGGSERHPGRRVAALADTGPAESRAQRFGREASAGPPHPRPRASLLIGWYKG